jgi:hypothetical protein
VLVREKHLLNAQLTVARQTESAVSGISKVQDPRVDRTLNQSTVLEHTSVLTGNSTVPLPQSQRNQISSSGHTNQTHPSMLRGDASLFGRLQGQAQEQGQPVKPYDRSVSEEIPPLFPTKIGHQSTAERGPNRADPVYQSRAQLEERWSARQALSQNTGPQSSSSFNSCVEESIPDFNALSRDSFASDSMMRSRGMRDMDQEGHTQERVMTSSEFVKYVKARRKVNQ